ncbi:hypothetical protein FHS16_001094 [Paenibacillus endophyticus]|uniref:Uncharacterized protein n=1 Tax=Paenibacillus endophyticus TaxID=1294268 RepID=A0A7W5G8V5_9BACL|nr:hypothetical protein [Paenibacillus endophyticus]MBB3151060.1 hypothetical protein [Paenibacillus endophyticus]
MKQARTSFMVIFLIAFLLLPLSERGQAQQGSSMMHHKPKKTEQLHDANRLIMTVGSSRQASFVSELYMERSELDEAIRHAKHKPSEKAEFYPDIYITHLTPARAQYRLERSGQLWNEAQAVSIELPSKLAKHLTALAEGLRMQHYGKLLTWQQSTDILPNKAIFSVTELESGLTFRVQRRAGSDHADVQPITKEDSRIMKQIYNGKWSWKRKAVLIRANGHWLAASMNGMPHGGDGIPENGFSGHFCIHFLGSSTHKSDRPDPAHQMMVHKAAGLLNPYLDSADPQLLALTFVEALYHKDEEIIQLLTDKLPEEKQAAFIQHMQQWVSIRVQLPAKGKQVRLPEISSFGDGLSAEIKLPVTIHTVSGQRRNGSYIFQFNRASSQSPWYIQEVNDQP